MVKTVELRMPASVWWRLADVAEAQGRSLPGLIVGVLAELADKGETALPRVWQETGSVGNLSLILAEVREAKKGGWRPPYRQGRKAAAQ